MPVAVRVSQSAIPLSARIDALAIDGASSGKLRRLRSNVVRRFASTRHPTSLEPALAHVARLFDQRIDRADSAPVTLLNTGGLDAADLMPVPVCKSAAILRVLFDACLLSSLSFFRRDPLRLLYSELPLRLRKGRLEIIVKSIG